MSKPFAAIAPIYDEYRHKYSKTAIEHIKSRASLTTTSKVLDLACGNGTCAKRIGKRWDSPRIPFGIWAFWDFAWQSVGLLNLLGATREEPEQVRDSDMSPMQTPRDPEYVITVKYVPHSGPANNGLHQTSGARLLQ